VNDGSNTVDASYVLTVTYTPPAANYIDFSQYTIDGELRHDSSRTGTQTINGTSLTFDGKMDGEVDETVTVTANTTLEFDFSSTGRGNYHWIGLTGLDGGGYEYNFLIYGKKSARSQDFALPEYSGSGTEHYSVKLSDFVPLGTYDTMFFKQLGPQSSMNSTWSNVEIHE
jgi:hypothetical protein